MSCGGLADTVLNLNSAPDLYNVQQAGALADSLFYISNQGGYELFHSIIIKIKQDKKNQSELNLTIQCSRCSKKSSQ